ncbi:MAG: hypothetical protein AB7D57_04775 [Desulfovibrionaceae bacterium]
MNKMAGCIVLILLIIPCEAYAQLQCEDIRDILKTYAETTRLNEKYSAYLREKYNWDCRDYFYGAFIDDEYETIFQCLVKGDRQLIAAYIDFVIASKRSADEAIAGYLGMLYLQRKDDVLYVLTKSNPLDRDYIINVLERDAFKVAPAGSMNVDIDAIREELREFQRHLITKQ